jgi:predicted O-linked N-acetylglucosamine transferase (SPINDLY family)
MDDLQALQQQLEEARDEAELNLLQLQQVQEELEFYFLRCQQQDQELDALRQAAAAAPDPEPVIEANPSEREELQRLQDALARSESQRADLQRQHDEQQKLLSTAQTLLEGQARYLEDVSLREERAAQAVDRLRLLEAEIIYYVRNSHPQPGLDAQRITRLIQLVRQPTAQGAGS